MFHTAAGPVVNTLRILIILEGVSQYSITNKSLMTICIFRSRTQPVFVFHDLGKTSNLDQDFLTTPLCKNLLFLSNLIKIVYRQVILCRIINLINLIKLIQALATARFRNSYGYDLYFYTKLLIHLQIATNPRLRP